MNSRAVTGIILVSATLLITLGSISGCQNGLPVNQVITGEVTKVHDGDSIHITPDGRDRVIIRLAAIDAPEITQDHGIQSRDYLRGLILNQPAKAHCNKKDRYSRQVCRVTTASDDEVDINLEMLKAGKAWYFTRFKDEQSRSLQRSYRKAETSARRKHLGLWRSGSSIPPWEFRSQANN